MMAEACTDISKSALVVLKGSEAPKSYNKKSMNKIQIFSHEWFGKIRTMTMPDGQVWFVGKDVKERLGYSNPKHALSTHVDEEDKLRSQIATSGQNHMMLLINESGLYSSRLPQTKEFIRCLT